MKQPHIVIFNPDQWRGDVMGHLGNPAAQTPVLDHMVASDAVSFRNAFCQNPVCTPSRCSFMTGWYPHVRGHRTMHHLLHPERDEPMLLDILRAQGYHVFWGGKNDLIADPNGLAGHADTWPDPSRYERNPNWHGATFEQSRGSRDDDSFYSFYVGKLAKQEGADYYQDLDWMHVMEAIRLIRHRPKDTPLCIYLPLGNPHPPYGVEEPFFSAIDRSVLPDRLLPPEGWTGKPSILPKLARNFGMASWSEERWTELRAVYYGMCMRVDALLGELIQALRDEGLYDDTALFMFADHGDFTGDYGLVEKTQNTFEDCLTRVPFVVKPPRYVPMQPGVCDALVELVDFSETVYDLTGIDPGYSRFGQSLLPVLTGESDVHRDAVFCEGGRLRGERHCMERESHTEPFTDNPYWPRLSLQADDDHTYHTKAVMCRTASFKYVRRHDEPDELYDLVQDPGETRNLCGDPAYAETLNQMRERLLTWYMETCDVVPMTSDPR